jgi:transaldolase
MLCTQNMAAEMLHVHAKNFPHKREALIDALIGLDDELTAHEQTQQQQQQQQQGQGSEVDKWLAEAPPALRQSAVFQELTKHASRS